MQPPATHSPTFFLATASTPFAHSSVLICPLVYSLSLSPLTQSFVLTVSRLHCLLHLAYLFVSPLHELVVQGRRLITVSRIGLLARIDPDTRRQHSHGNTTRQTTRHTNSITVWYVSSSRQTHAPLVFIHTPLSTHPQHTPLSLAFSISFFSLFTHFHSLHRFTRYALLLALGHYPKHTTDHLAEALAKRTSIDSATRQKPQPFSGHTIRSLDIDKTTSFLANCQ